MSEVAVIWEQFKDTPKQVLLSRNINRVVESIERQETMSLEQFMDALNSDARSPRASIRVSRYCAPNRTPVWYTELIVSNVWEKDADGWYKSTYVMGDYFATPASSMPWRSTIKGRVLKGIDFQRELQHIQNMDAEHKVWVDSKKEGK